MLVDGYRKKIKIRDHTGQLKYVAVCLPSVWPGTSTDWPYLPVADKRSAATVLPIPSTVRGTEVSTHARYSSQVDSADSF